MSSDKSASAEPKADASPSDLPAQPIPENNQRNVHKDENKQRDNENSNPALLSDENQRNMASGNKPDNEPEVSNKTQQMSQSDATASSTEIKTNEPVVNIETKPLSQPVAPVSSSEDTTVDPERSMIANLGDDIRCQSSQVVLDESTSLNTTKEISEDTTKTSTIEDRTVSSSSISTGTTLQTSNTHLKTIALGCMIAVVVVLVCLKGSFSMLPTSSKPQSENNWRSKIDPNNYLSIKQRNTLCASLKPILDQSSILSSNSISTLLIISSNEENAATLARCVLQLVHKKPISSAEIDITSYGNNKLALDSNLRLLLSSTGGARAVLLRRIDEISSNALEQARLLFAYCDGENPVISDRLFIMTATSDYNTESGLRENFKSRWPHEHDFVDALMSRISGHVIYADDGQKPIC